MAQIYTAQDPLGLSRLAEMNLRKRELGIREQEAARRGELQNLQMQTMRAQEQTRLSGLREKQRALQEQQRLKQGLGEAFQQEQGGNRYQIERQYYIQNNLNDRLMKLDARIMKQVEQLEKVDKEAAKDLFNMTIGEANGIEAHEEEEKDGEKWTKATVLRDGVPTVVQIRDRDGFQRVVGEARALPQYFKKENAIVKPLLDKMPAMEQEAEMAKVADGRSQKMLEILDRQGDKVTGWSGGIRKALASPAKMIGLNIDSLTDAQILETLLTEGQGALRMQVVGPGQVTEYEQRLLKQVAGGKMSTAKGLRKLLEYNKEKLNSPATITSRASILPIFIAGTLLLIASSTTQDTIFPPKI